MPDKKVPIDVVTVQDHIEHRHGIKLHCRACGLYKDLDLPKLVADGDLAPEFKPTPENLCRRFRCPECRSKDLGVIVTTPSTAD